MCNVRSCTLFHIRRSSSGSCGTHGLHAVVAASHGPPALIPSHSKLPFRVCFWAPSWGPGPWESRAQRAHNPIWQEMVGMPGYIHSRTHSPTWLAQRLLLKAGALTSAHTHTHACTQTNRRAINSNTLMRVITVRDSWQRSSTDKDYNRCLKRKNASLNFFRPYHQFQGIYQHFFMYYKKNVKKEKQINKYWQGTVPPDSNVVTFDLLCILLPALPCKPCKGKLWLQPDNRTVT